MWAIQVIDVRSGKIHEAPSFVISVHVSWNWWDQKKRVSANRNHEMTRIYTRHNVIADLL